MICLRCYREFSDPVPKPAFPDGVREIATVHWCADCNAYAMSLVYRDSSAYRPASKQEFPPPPKLKVPDEVISAIFAERPLCTCGQKAYAWDGKKSLCLSCLEKQKDFERGYAYSPDGITHVTLEEKYGQVS